MQLCSHEAKLPNLMLKTWPEQLLSFLPLDIMLPGITDGFMYYSLMNINDIGLFIDIV
jgi:hypothetical protein